MFDKAKEKISKIASGEFIQDHVSESIQSISEIIPLLKKNGYSLEGIELELGIPTGITVGLKRNGEAVEQLKEIEALVEGQKVKSWIVGSLIKINSMQDMFHKVNVEIDEVKIGLKLPPSINVKLKPKK